MADLPEVYLLVHGNQPEYTGGLPVIQAWSIASERLRPMLEPNNSGERWDFRQLESALELGAPDYTGNRKQIIQILGKISSGGKQYASIPNIREEFTTLLPIPV